MHTSSAHAAPADMLIKRRQLRALIAQVPWLGQLDEQAVEELLDGARVQVAMQREWLFHQQAPAHWLYIVISGGVRLVRAATESRPATVRCVERGGTIGELSMAYRELTYLYSAETLRRTHLLAIPTELCSRLFKEHPACRAEFMSCLALELVERLEDLAMLTQVDAMARLVSYLLRQLPAGRTREPRVLRFTIPKYWLAAQLAMTPETLSRLLAKLRNQGVIATDRQRLEILNEQGLRDILADAG